MVAISCSKECECEIKMGGQVIETETVEIEDGKCSDMNSDVFGVVTECK
ncbi:MAG: hypothetical protein J6R59_07085 [Paludibacteraceae bacterium]|nr:hypothetical protein [Paludibacteraceae bacterium]